MSQELNPDTTTILLSEVTLTKSGFYWLTAIIVIILFIFILAKYKIEFIRKNIRYIYTIFTLLMGLLCIIFSENIHNNVLPSLIGIQDWKSIGASMIAAISVYILYDAFARNEEIEIVAENTSKKAVDVVINLYQKRYENLVPEEVYSTRIEVHQNSITQSKFEEDLVGFLQDSNRYYIKTHTGVYASKRLNNLCKDNRFTMRDVRFLLLDPRNQDLTKYRISCENPYLESENPEKFKQEIKDKTLEVFDTLINLFLCRHQCSSTVAFYSEYAFYRLEMLQQCMFLTFYKCLNSDGYNTFRYSSRSFIFPAYQEHFTKIFDLSEHENSYFNLTSPLEDRGFSDMFKKLAEECGVLSEAMNKLISIKISN